MTFKNKSNIFAINEMNRIETQSGRHTFITTTYNDISVIIDKETGYYSASKICRANKKQFSKWLENKRTQELLNKLSARLQLEVERVENSLLFQLLIGKLVETNLDKHT